MSTTQIRRQIMILLDSVSLHLLLSPCGDQNANSFALFSTQNANQCLITLFSCISFTFSSTVSLYSSCLFMFIRSLLVSSVQFISPLLFLPNIMHAFAVFEYSLMCTL
eukprot:966821_1